MKLIAKCAYLWNKYINVHRFLKKMFTGIQKEFFQLMLLFGPLIFSLLGNYFDAVLASVIKSSTLLSMY